MRQTAVTIWEDLPVYFACAFLDTLGDRDGLSLVLHGLPYWLFVSLRLVTAAL